MTSIYLIIVKKQKLLILWNYICYSGFLQASIILFYIILFFILLILDYINAISIHIEWSRSDYTIVQLHRGCLKISTAALHSQGNLRFLRYRSPFNVAELTQVRCIIHEIERKLQGEYTYCPASIHRGKSFGKKFQCLGWNFCIVDCAILWTVS